MRYARRQKRSVEAFKLAELATTPAERLRLLQEAATWKKMADEDLRLIRVVP
jgi:hypothetical protein